MTSVALLEKPQLTLSFEEFFLQELIEQFHLQDRSKVYQSWSDRLLLELFVTSKKSVDNFNLDCLNQLLINAFYQAIAKIIKEKTGHTTQTFVHVKNQEYSSAVVFCGGVLVVYSLLWGYKKYGFNSIDRLLEEAEKIIEAAVTKANLYLDFVA